jgi:hypothetical protein
MEQAHLTQVWLAAGDDPKAQVTGEYFYHLKRMDPNPQADDPALQDRLRGRQAGPLSHRGTTPHGGGRSAARRGGFGLLKFVKSEHGDVELTPVGKTFAEADISTRKKIFRDAVLANVHLLHQMNSALARKSSHTMPVELFRDILEEHFADNEVQRQIDTVLNWGRYGEIFTYDSENDRLLLHAAAEPVVAGTTRPENS